jgi:protein-tyrosine-phosphatase
MEKVVFICRGNMHRSPTAAGLYNMLKKDNSFAESYGTMVEAEGRSGIKLSTYPGFDRLINYLKKYYNIDISNHLCTQLKQEFLLDADKIIVMAEEEFIPTWLKEYNYEHWNILDDFSTDEKLTKDIDCIKTKVESLFYEKN